MIARHYLDCSSMAKRELMDRSNTGCGHVAMAKHSHDFLTWRLGACAGVARYQRS
jgi:hypothetical protein